MSTVAGAIADSAVIAKRNVIKIKRVPEVLVFVLLSPIMFVLLFGFVFGDAIEVPGGDYREFLLAGIFAQTVMFGATFTGAGIAEGTSDELKGLVGGERSEVVVGPDEVQKASDVLLPLACGELQIDHHLNRLVVPCEGGAKVLTAALRELDDAGVEVRDVGLRRPTLDDVFLTLTGHHAAEAEEEERPRTREEAR